MTHHRVGATNYGLSPREVELVRLSNLDLDLKIEGFFRINSDCFECDACGSRIPHNGKAGDDAVQDFDLVEDEILCRLCRSGHLDENRTGFVDPPTDPEVIRIDAELNAELDREATIMMNNVIPFNRPKEVRPDA